MAKNSRGSVSVIPFAALKIDTRITSATTVPARGPSTTLAAWEATRVLAATPATPSAAKYPMLATT